MTLRESTEGLMPDEAAQALADYDAILPTLGDQFTADAFAGPGPSRVFWATFGVGYNHIDVAAAPNGRAIVGLKHPRRGDGRDRRYCADPDLGRVQARGRGRKAAALGHVAWAGRRRRCWAPMSPASGSGSSAWGGSGRRSRRRCHYGFDMPVIYFNRSQKDVDVPARQVETLAAH